MKQLTMCAVLGLAVMGTGIDQAQATFMEGQGDFIETSYLVPNTASVVAGPNSTEVVAGTELTNFGPVADASLDIDFQNMKIKMTFNVNPQFDFFDFFALNFNGLRFKDDSGIPAWVVSINQAETIGLSASDLLNVDLSLSTFDDIYVNLGGLRVHDEDMLVLNVKPVPEPSTMILLGSGLAGIVAWRYRKQQA